MNFIVMKFNGHILQWTVSIWTASIWTPYKNSGGGSSIFNQYIELYRDIEFFNLQTHQRFRMPKASRLS